MQSPCLGALPVLYAVLDVLQVQAVINHYCPNRLEIDNGTVVLVLILNRLMAPRPLLKIADWVAKTVLVHRLGVPASKPLVLRPKDEGFNDDQLACTLDDLAPHCRHIWVEIVSVARQHYDINLNMIFYDLTAFVAHGDYAESDHIDFGFAHPCWPQRSATRPAKRKFKVGLNVTADGNVPVSYCPWPGSAADKATAQSKMGRLSKLLRAHGLMALTFRAASP